MLLQKQNSHCSHDLNLVAVKKKERKNKKNEHRGEISHITVTHDDHVRTSYSCRKYQNGEASSGLSPYQILHKSVGICPLQYKQAFANTVPEKLLGRRHKLIHDSKIAH